MILVVLYIIKRVIYWEENYDLQWIKKKASIEYAKRSLKRIPLDVQKEKCDEIKAAADKAGETVNGYIKKAIEQRMESENGSVEW